MLKTEREKRICAKYSAPDEDGYVHCGECPLTVHTDSTDVGCKAWMHYDRHLRDWVMDEENKKHECSSDKIMQTLYRRKAERDR